MLLIGALLAVAPDATAAPPKRAHHATTIRIDGHAHGRRFDGVGAISGGGGNARYLIDYPKAARRAILDSLFKPGYGAALQILKVEIGGDANSTDGAEPSIEHTQGAIDCDTGYEWWLMRQAKARNPAIRLYGLAWAAPGWTGRFWSRRTIRYMIHWLGCARKHHLRIDYLGGTQNEGRSGRQYDPAWTKALRRAMNRAGFRSTELTMSEAFDPRGRWRVARDLARDRRFRRATGVVANHDVCGYPTDGLRCRSTRAVRRLGLPLWASELGGIEGDRGAAGVARAMIRGYPTARLTGYVTWPIISAMPPGLPHQEDGLISAGQPWSGHYRVYAMTHALAMVSWFTAPGWRYVNGANGGLRGARGRYARGAFATLRSPRGHDWSTLAETTTARRATRVRFVVRGGLPARRVHVWRADLSPARRAGRMVRRRDVRPRHGRFGFTLRPGYVYAFTTLERRARRSARRPPARAAFPDYADGTAANPDHDAPRYLAAMDGAFVHRRCWDDRRRTCIQQMAPRAPVFWHRHRGFPYAVIGDGSLRDYTVSCEVRLRSADASAGVIARFSSQGKRISAFRGYILDLDASGRWRLLRNSRRTGVSTLAAGMLPGAQGWHAVALQVRGGALAATIDGTRVATVVDPRRGYARGIAGVEAGAESAGGAFTGASWPVVQYRRLAIERPG